MNYGSEPADQVIRYYLEGTEYALKLTGTAAKNFAVFAAAVLKDQKKTHGKTKLVRLLRENKPLKFFSVPADRMYEFSKEANKRGLLFVPIRDRANPDDIEIAILAEDAAKVNRVIDKMQLDVVDVGTAEAVSEVEQDLAEQETAPAVEKQTVETETGSVTFEVDESEDLFNMGFTPAPPMAEKEPQFEPFSTSSGNLLELSKPHAEREIPKAARSEVDRLRARGERPSVRMELGEIKTLLFARKKEQARVPQLQRPIKINRSERMM